MAYNKTVWKDRVVEKPRNYKITNNEDGTITLTPSPGTVTEQGTPITAIAMNNIEDGIVNNENLLDDVYKKNFALGNTKICINALLISDEYDGYTGVRQGQTINLPTGFLVGMRIQLRYDGNNYVVILYDAQSNREWRNFYNGSVWCGWREVSIGELNLNKKPCCKVYHPTNQVFPGGSVKNTVAWDNVLFSSHAGMCGNVGTTANIVAPVDGIYQFDASITVVGATGQIQANLSKNNEEVIDSKNLVCSGGSNTLHLSGMYPMNKGEYVQIHLWHYESSPITVSNISRFQGNYVRGKI